MPLADLDQHLPRVTRLRAGSYDTPDGHWEIRRRIRRSDEWGRPRVVEWFVTGKRSRRGHRYVAETLTEARCYILAVESPSA